MAEVVVGKGAYILAWVVLMLLLVLTAGVSFIDLGSWNGPVAMAIAAVKTIIVILIFMHLKYEKKKTVWIFAVGAVFWLSIMMLLTMVDYVTRGVLAVPGK